MGRAWTLAPAAALTWVVAGLATLHQAMAPALTAGSATVMAGAIVMTWRSRRAVRLRRAGVLIGLVALTTGVAAANVWSAAGPREHVIDLAERQGALVSMTATVTGKIEPWGSEHLAFDAVASAVGDGEGAHAVSAVIRIVIAPDDIENVSALDAGAVVGARGSFRVSEAGERAVAQVHATAVEVLRPAGGVLRISSDLRRGLLAAVDGLPSDGASLVPGLAVGDTLLVTEQMDAAMKESSLSHLTAVSGSNCALVVGLAFAAAAASGLGRTWRIVVAMLALGGFVVLVTPEPSVVRAAGMAAVAMLALLLGRTSQGVAVLSAALAVALAADPWLSGSLGFGLSAAATGSLLLFARPLANGLARIMPQGLALVLAVPLAAQLACGPLLILITPSVPLYGVAANVLAAPAAPLVTVVGLAACLVAPILPVVASGLAALAWVPATWIAATASTVSALPGDQLPWIEGLGGALLLTAVSAAIGLAVALPAGGTARRRVHGIARGAVAVLAGVAGGTAALAGVFGPATLPASWQMLACDVGQGDAVLVRADDRVALIDTGPDPEALRICLDRVGVDRLDLVVLSHFDHDHVGAAAVVAERTGVMIHGPVDGPDDTAIVTSFRDAGARVLEVAADDAGTLGSARWRVLWPREDAGVAPGNDASVVVAFTDGGLPSILLLGDLSEEPQRQLLPLVDSPFEVVKVAHHGSADQSAALYEAVSARLGVVTVGENDYGHPRAEALALIESNGGVVARTDTDGIVAVWREAGVLRVWRDHAGAVGAGG